MKFIEASHVSKQTLDAFLETNKSMSKQSLMKEGYVILVEEEMKGCFTLSTISEEECWLKQLYIQPEIANRLLVLMETILVMTKEMEAKKLYVHSHQPLLDLILDALQFEKVREDINIERPAYADGKWWEYEVS